MAFISPKVVAVEADYVKLTEARPEVFMAECSQRTLLGGSVHGCRHTLLYELCVTTDPPHRFTV